MPAYVCVVLPNKTFKILIPFPMKNFAFKIEEQTFIK